MKVHSILGNGFQEIIYQRALAIEMTLAGLSFEMEKEMKIYYRDHEIGTRRSDFFVEEKIMVEIKAKSNLENINLNQAMNYLEAYYMEIGLLINFGAKSLQFKRVHNNKIIKDNSSTNQEHQLRQENQDNQENQANQGNQGNQG